MSSVDSFVSVDILSVCKTLTRSILAMPTQLEESNLKLANALKTKSVSVRKVCVTAMTLSCREPFTQRLCVVLPRFQQVRMVLMQIHMEAASRKFQEHEEVLF